MAARARARYELTAEDKSGKAFRSFRRSLGDATKEVGAFVGAAAAIGGTAVLGGLAALTRGALVAGDRLGKLSLRLGATTEFLSEMQHATQQTGVSFESFATGIQRMSRRIAEGAKGTTEAIAALGLRIEDLQKLSIEDQFLSVADALDKTADQGQKLALAMKLFDTEGVALLQTLDGGASAIEAMRAESRALGSSLSGKDAKAIADYNDAVGRLQTAFRGLGFEIAGVVAGPLTDLANQIPGLAGAAADLLVGDTGDALDKLGSTVRPLGPADSRFVRDATRGNAPRFNTGGVDAFLDKGGKGAAPAKVEDAGVTRTNELMEALIDETRLLGDKLVLG